MTTQLVLKSAFEQNPLEFGSVEVSEVSTPVKPPLSIVKTALYGAPLGLMNLSWLRPRCNLVPINPLRMPSLPGMVALIWAAAVRLGFVSLCPNSFNLTERRIVEPVGKTSNAEVSTSGEGFENKASPTVPKFVQVLEKAEAVIVELGLIPEETVVEISNTEVSIPVSILGSTSGEELENKALTSSALSNSVIQVLEETEEAKNSEIHKIAEKVDGIFAKVVDQIIETFEAPLEGIALGLEWMAVLVEELGHHPETFIHGLEKGAAFFGLFGLIAKVNKISKIFFEIKDEGVEALDLSKLMTLGFSIGEVVCNGLSSLSKIGLISPAAAFVWRLTLIGAFFSLMIATIDLGNNIINYQNPTKLLKALFVIAVDIAILVLIAYTVAHLNILLLILGTGIFILHVAIPDEEELEVKEVH